METGSKHKTRLSRGRAAKTEGKPEVSDSKGTFLNSIVLVRSMVRESVVRWSVYNAVVDLRRSRSNYTHGR